ncbi:acyl carrier protein [Streptomyces prunicolor]|uniref:acyl carrier protein n=1 Tax=Streptomyces prunicolor TaxID=67348 RepID=UPI00224E7FD6|nr:acyl carrier protein [Streptomyces prunicolor]MCX5233915.1 acyl carrier protein [Streptomyces prunicolor]
MDQGWVAVIGAAVGSTGAAAAAFVTGRAGRRQASLQAASQQEQWRRQLRRETYGALLSAGSEARDQLGAVYVAQRSILFAPRSAADMEPIVERLNETKPLVDAVRHATATIFVEGPPSVLEPARRVEEGLVLFHTAMLALATDQHNAGDENGRYLLAICGRQRVDIRADLLNFASAARKVFDGDSSQEPVSQVSSDSYEPSAIDATWFLNCLVEALGLPESEFELNGTIWDNGFNSLSLVRIGVVLDRLYGLRLAVRWFTSRQQLTLRQLAGELGELRSGSPS